MDLEKLTMQDLLKIEGFTDRCRIARRYPLAMMVAREMQFCDGCDDIAKYFNLIPPIPVGEWNAHLEMLAEIFGPIETACGPVEYAKPAAIEKPAAPAEVAPAVKPAAVPAAKDEKPAEAVKPAEGRGAGRPPKAAAIPTGEIPDFDKLSKPELRDFCVKHSVISRVKKDMGNSKHESMLRWCKEHFGAPTAAAPIVDKPAEAAPAAKAEKPAEATPAENKPAGPISPYEGLGVKELYCICKDRGLAVAERQEAEVYKQALEIDDLAREGRELLKAANEAKKQAEAAEEAAEKPAEIDITAVPVPEEETEEFDEWDDVPAEAEKPAEAAAVDDDDDWDI